MIKFGVMRRREAAASISMRAAQLLVVAGSARAEVRSELFAQAMLMAQEAKAVMGQD